VIFFEVFSPSSSSSSEVKIVPKESSFVVTFVDEKGG